MYLKDIAQISNKKTSFKGCVNYISTENMQPDKGGIVPAATFPSSGTVSVYQKGDILLSNIRPYFKKIWHATVDGTASNDVIVFHANGGVNSRYLYYILADDNFFAYVMTGAKGTKMPRGDRKQILQYPVNLPPVEEQKRIAQILGALDDKIELLQKQNKTLEDMAKAIFKSWFVDFDVVHAKAALTKSSNLSPSVICPPCGESAPTGQKGVKNEENTFCNNYPPTPPNGGTSPARGADNGPSHQLYTKHVKNLVRGMRQNLTPQEVKLWQHLRKEQLGVKFRRQFPIDSKYIADFACLEKKLVLELDGSQHAENPSDKERTLYLEDNGFTVLRFWNSEIDHNLMGCLEKIRQFLHQPPLPACGVLSPQGGQIKNKADIMREYHLTDELYDLFPSDFENSSLGPIPLGWQVKTLSNIATLTMGQSPAGTTYNESGEGLPFYQGRTDFEFRFPKKRVYCSAPTRIAEKGDVLISVRAPVGDLNMANERCCIGRGVASIRPNTPNNSFLYYAMLNIQKKFDVFNTEGTVFGSINRKDLSSLAILTPSEDVLREFNAIVTSFDLKIEENLKQIQTLTELRDTLLPRLISGKIRV